MAIFDSLFNFKSNSKRKSTVEQRSNTSDSAILDAIINGKYSNGGAVTGISAVFAAIELISNSIAELPIVVKKEKEVDKGHPINFIFDSALQGKFNLMKQLIFDMIIHGAGLCYIKRAQDGTPIGLIYCENGSYTTFYNQNSQTLYFSIPFLKKNKVDPKDVIYLYKNSQNGVEGKSIISYAKKIFDLCKYTDTAASDWFANGMNLSGILKVAGNPSAEEIEKIRMNWKRLHSGDGASGLAILKQNMEYQPIGTNATDSQLLETRLFNVTEVARFFNISPVLLGDLSKSSYNTIEAANLEFVSHTLLPYISLIECEFNRKLLKQSERAVYSIDLDENYLLRTDKTSTANYLSTLVAGGILSINEARNQLGFGEIEGGDSHIIAYTDINQNTIEGAEESESNDQSDISTQSDQNE